MSNTKSVLEVVGESADPCPEILSWAIETFHNLGLTRYLSQFLKSYSKVPYRTFYEGLIALGEDRPHTVLGGVLAKAKEDILNQAANNTYDYFLQITSNLRTFYREIAYWTANQANLKTLKGQALIGDLLWVQEACLITMNQLPSEELNLKYAIPEYLSKTQSNQEATLEQGEFSYIVNRPKTYTNLEEYYAEVLDTKNLFNQAVRI